MRRCAAACLLLTLAPAGAARALPPFEAGAVAGTTLWGDIERLSPVAGVQLVAPLFGPLSAELAVLRFTDWDREERLGAVSEGEVGVTPVSLTLRAAVPLGRRLRACAAAGAACYVYDEVELRIRADPARPRVIAWTDDASVDLGNAMGGHLGLGLEWRPGGGPWTFGIDYRYASLQNHGAIHGLTAVGPGGDFVIREFRNDFVDNQQLGILRLGISRAIP